MRHDSHDAGCKVCLQNVNLGRPLRGGVFWQNELWLLLHYTDSKDRAPLAGWLVLHAQRHVHWPATFDDAEAILFGPTLRHLSRALGAATGCDRVYNVGMGESSPHLHSHLVLRHAVDDRTKG